MQRISGLLLVFMALLSACRLANAQETTSCPRPASGAIVAPPPDLYSQQGILKVHLNYLTTVDPYGRTLFCFQVPDGKEAPTLHVWPGDEIRISLTDEVPEPSDGPQEAMSNSANVCGSATMSAASVNMHFHGMNVPPTCHSDEVIHTLVNSGQTFEYRIQIPKDEPPGLYWYHPHVHGIAEPAVQGGASGVIEVEGIANVQPLVAGLPQRFLVIRDQPLANPPTSYPPHPKPPAWDVSVNYVPISYPGYQPGVIRMSAGTQEFWRVANASADTILDLQLNYDGKAQPLTVVALDGVPTGSQDGTREGKTFVETDVFIPPAGRAEFLVSPPALKVRRALLVTKKIDTGPQGDNDLTRPLLSIQLGREATALPRTPERNGPPNPLRFTGLADAQVTAHRTLYFSEINKKSEFYITAEGAKPVLFSADNPPSIVTHQGAVEDWTIENRAGEVHEFHIHQIHFLLLALNGVPVPKGQQQYYDTYNVPYWSGSGPYPSITVRMDFRGAVVGDFVYHCHILEHEDGGMMAIVRVLPKA